MTAPAIRIHDSITAIAPTAWDALVGAEPLASHGWLRTHEACLRQPHRTSYVVASDGDRLVGAAACARADRRDGLAGPDDVLLGRLARPASRLGLSFCPALLCGPRSCFGPPVFVDPSLDADAARATVAAVLDAVARLAAEERRAVCAMHVPAGADGPVAALAARGYHVAADAPACVLDVTWTSFDGYLEHLRGISTKLPRNVRAEMRRTGAGGVEIREIADIGPAAARLHELARRHTERHSVRPFPYAEDLFPRLRDALGPDALVYGAFHGDDLVGFSLFLCKDGVGHGYLVGLDRLRTDATYFSLCYYRPIMDAVEGRMRRIVAGQALRELKRRRGFRVVDVCLAYRGRGPIHHRVTGPWFALHARWQRRKLRPPRPRSGGAG
ncbi:MAG: GNAT family N-acetyltransferase [Planctomycetota bacterium]|jgi:predicted N-acyltransferase